VEPEAFAPPVDALYAADPAFLHEAQYGTTASHEADMYGNALFRGISIADMELARAAKRLIVTAEKLVTNATIRANPTATFMRFVPGSCGAGTPRRRHARPPSSLAQHSTSPSHRPWQGWLKIVAISAPSGIFVRFGQAQTLSIAM
jgi:hypothetical protein